jgi:glycosyltransferase involved in cell wall biosynthesis
MNIILSVGMIVKNEEKYLEKCLSALKPLLDHDEIPSELVIVDTGSTDRTIEIAKSFTDKVFHFDWVNDFAAARNFSLGKCTGEWFMFLDGDEIFDDLSEIIAFFTDKSALKKYNSAAYIQRNYTKPDGSAWGDCVPSRIVKRFEGLRFVSPIHENFSAFPEPTMKFSSFVHHWGYAFETEEQRRAKDQRNIPLLRAEIEKNPDDMRLHFLLIGNLNNEEREEFFPEVLKKAKTLQDKYWSSIALTYITLHYYNIEDYDKALSYHAEFFALMQHKENSVLFLDMHVIKAVISQKQGDYDEALAAFEKYFKLYELYKAGKLSTSEAGAVSLTCHDPEEHAKLTLLYNGIKAHREEKQMKTEIAENLVKTISYNYDRDITLSVSMIVKNEEKMLVSCLDGIKPLLDAVPSELIIIDTGSSDRTVEIAKHYTDKVFHFDWIDDFSAARNFGLEKCKGMWFMFLDADDHFQDVSDMIEFFNDEEKHKDFNTAYYITRNFTTSNYDEYFSFYAHRIARKTDNLRFEGAIHEYFTGYYNPAYYFKSYAHHYGYAFESMEQQRKKSERNLVLLEKELEKNPEDLRTIGHIIGSMVDMDEKKRAFTEKAVVLSDKFDTPVSYPAYFTAFEMYHADNETEKALAVLDKAIKKAKPDDGVLTEAYACRGYSLYNAGRYAEAEESIKKYLAYLERLEKGELDKSVFAFLVANYSAPEKRGSFINLLALCISKQGGNKLPEALRVYSDTDWSGLASQDFKNAAGTIFEVVNAAKSKDEKEAVFKNLTALYEKILGTETEEKINYFEQALEKLYYLNRDDKLFAGSFKDSKGKFSALMRLCAEPDDDALEAFINTFDPLPEGYSAAIELAVKNNISLSTAIAKMNLEIMRTHLSVIAQNNIFLPVQAIGYQSDEFFFSSIKNLLFGTLLFEAACFNAGSLTEAQKSEVYSRCVNYCSLYVSNVYNPDLLNEDDIGVLSESHRFGYFMGSAKKLLDSADKLGYIRELKKALASCNSMQDIIKFLIEEFSASL